MRLSLEPLLRNACECDLNTLSLRLQEPDPSRPSGMHGGMSRKHARVVKVAARLAHFHRYVCICSTRLTFRGTGCVLNLILDCPDCSSAADSDRPGAMCTVDKRTVRICQRRQEESPRKHCAMRSASFVCWTTTLCGWYLRQQGSCIVCSSYHS